MRGIIMVQIKLTGQNLGERQKELNHFVNNATSWDPTYNSIGNESSDVDMIFRIDLASKLKNIDFLINILKSGDSLYISRVLKHVWIFDMEYSNLMNPVYLHKEIFPFMSEKMKKKLITAVSMHIKDEMRIKQFCEYCFETQRNELASKFLLFTPHSYKMQFLENLEYNFPYNEPEYMNNFVGNSFDLAKKSLHTLSWLQPIHLSRLYSVSSSEFLDIFENYEWDDTYYHQKLAFGARFTKTVVKNDKDRVLKNPVLYYNYLNSNALLKNITSEDAQIILAALYPNTAYDFWSQNYYKKYEDLLNIIPFEGRFKFIKENFEKNYPKEEFEMSKCFYFCDLYELMTIETQEKWALTHIENNNGFFGDTHDYTWYEFVTLQKAFPIIKSVLNKTNDKDRRHTLLGVLLKSTKNHSELEILLQYFYERHINEQNRERFVESVLEKYTILEYNETTFSIIDKLFHAVEVYNKDIAYGTVKKLRALIILHHIVHDIPLSETLKSFILYSCTPHYLKCNLKRLKDNKQKVFDFLMNYVTEEISKFDSNNYSDDDKYKVKPFIQMAFDILDVYDLKYNNCPEVIRKYAMLDDNLKYYFIQESNKTFSQDDLLRLLKKDVVLLNEKLPLLNDSLSGNLNILLRKLRIYFTNDIAREWLKFFTNVLLDDKATFSVIFQAVYGAIALGTNKEREDLMVKYAPVADKIDHKLRKRLFEYVQEGICRFIGYSRPYVPLNLLMMYIKGDYLRFCLPMMGMQVANLPCTERLKFVQLLLDKPVSIQKHGIRLAFKCFSTEELTLFVQKTWVKTKNVSLRTILCRSMYKHLDTEKDESKKLQIINVIKEILLTVNADDDESVYHCFNGQKIPEKFRGEFLEFSWKTLNKYPDDKDNSRKQGIVVQMTRHIHLMREELVHGIAENHINESVDNPSLLTYRNRYVCSKWMLVDKCLSINKNEEDLEKKLIWMEKILNACIKSWNVVEDDVYTIREFYTEFISDLTNDSLGDIMGESEMKMISVVPIFKTIIKTMTSTFDTSVVYFTVLKLKLHITLQNAMYKFKDSKGSLPNNKADWQEVAIYMGEGIGELIKQLVVSKQYFASLLPEFLQLIPFCLQGIEVYYHNCDIGTDAFNVFLSHGLLKMGILETNIFALNLLPPEIPDEFEADFVLVVNNIKQLVDFEVKCAFYNKYSSDHKRRKYY